MLRNSHRSPAGILLCSPPTPAPARGRQFSETGLRRGAQLWGFFPWCWEVGVGGRGARSPWGRVELGWWVRTLCFGRSLSPFWPLERKGTPWAAGQPPGACLSQLQTLPVRGQGRTGVEVLAPCWGSGCRLLAGRGALWSLFSEGPNPVQFCPPWPNRLPKPSPPSTRAWASGSRVRFRARRRLPAPSIWGGGAPLPAAPGCAPGTQVCF